MRIAYVEDNVANIALVERICQMNNDELLTYNDADDALNEISDGFADLILMDLHLGTRSIDGLQLTRLLRQKGVTQPIIANINKVSSTNSRFWFGSPARYPAA